jgi:hypothetical protein
MQTFQHPDDPSRERCVAGQTTGARRFAPGETSGYGGLVDDGGEPTGGVERIVRLLTGVAAKRRLTAGQLTPYRASQVIPARWFREPLLLPLERAGPVGCVADAAQPGSGGHATGTPDLQSTCHRGSSCPS